MEELGKNNLIFHHVGCVTKNIENSKKIYINHLGFKSISKTYFISSQKVKICFIETAPGIYLELVEPTADNAFLTQLLKNKNPFYHTGYLTHNFTATLQNLLNNKFYLVSQFQSEAFGNRQCAFLYTAEKHLIELIQHND